MSDFKPCCLPLLIGSVPLRDHRLATEVVFAHTPQAPLWPQLPVYRQEGMIPQFLPGFPGVVEEGGKTYIDSAGAGFDADFLAFFEEYLMVVEGDVALEESRFALTPEIARGFFELLDLAREKRDGLIALKGQVTGPITFCTGVVDQSGRAIYYNEQLRDAAVKMLALKGRYQARKLGEIVQPAIVFFDEPGLSGFGSSAFITITADEITSCLREVFTGVKEEGGLTGVHVCANTEWSLLFDAGVDIVSYDAFGFFDRLILYPEQLKKFMAGGGILATGIVPTGAEDIERVSADLLGDMWFEQTARLVQLGIPEQAIYEQTFITPSCGTGTVSEAQMKKVMEMTRDISAAVRARLG